MNDILMMYILYISLFIGGKKYELTRKTDQDEQTDFCNSTRTVTAYKHTNGYGTYNYG